LRGGGGKKNFGWQNSTGEKKSTKEEKWSGDRKECKKVRRNTRLSRGKRRNMKRGERRTKRTIEKKGGVRGGRKSQPTFLPYHTGGSNGGRRKNYPIRPKGGGKRGRNLRKIETRICWNHTRQRKNEKNQGGVGKGGVPKGGGAWGVNLNDGVTRRGWKARGQEKGGRGCKIKINQTPFRGHNKPQ